MADACSETDFHASYGRSAATFLATIASRADCLAGGTYAQGGVVCPPQECGNGMLEIGSATQLDEECDDGNLTDGDGCSASCLRE
jgi:cysteine-rich repeat protein